MKIILLMIPSIIHSAKAPSNQTYHITKEVSHTLNKSIPLFKDISNRLKPNQLTFNNALHFGWFSFKDIKNAVGITGEISKNYLNVNFLSIKSLDQLNKFNEELTSSENLIHSFTSIVISLINNIFESIPEEILEKNLEISNKSNCLMRWLKMDNPNKITISVIRNWRSSEISFDCYLEEDSKTMLRNFNPNEEEEEVSKLLDKKEQ